MTLQMLWLTVVVIVGFAYVIYLLCRIFDAINAARGK